MRRENTSGTCECGRRKLTSVAACDRCIYLDGSTIQDFEMIQLLRESSDGYTVQALVAETGRVRESVYASLRRLERKGRVIRLQDAEGGGDQETRGRPAHLYRLIDRGMAA